ncbi:50S ribosomal protein L4 [Paracholeplasma manati]|jgi:large subunit ribosomal protein L4|uniref:Large ribosomal subunit protein uL4 n=1 Tax=Paracholeplasma manati TaxID=591373 RepID=A0ABT2Y4F1_9MOLU|nr:50S ribosomal protein L4 [Paracholeplasma manati]MCV2231606.1 50S ribosomal protein L4 [Paracholeplasma manati]MDG0888650.1 50S ribosomal protein L4 [Paracholeplasma manati]MDX9808075.1 50S ribosomal protein L4 [Acholeplasma sp.]
MPKLQVLNQQGSKVTDLTLNDYVFGIAPHNQALYDVVNAQRAAMRQGTHDTKTRAEVSGGGKKPWKQKGTGRARQGSTRSPQWRHGGIVFGPTPRSYDVKVNRKVAQLAMRSALSYHQANNSLVVVDALAVEQAKTKEFAALLSKLNITEKVLIVDTVFADSVFLAARNLPNVMLVQASHASVYDLLNCKQLLLTQNAVQYFEEVLA